MMVCLVVLPLKISIVKICLKSKYQQQYSNIKIVTLINILSGSYYIQIICGRY